MEKVQQKHNNLIKRINSVRLKQKRVALLSGAIYFIGVAGVAILLSILLELFFKFETDSRILIDVLLIIFILIIGIIKIGKPLFLILLRKNYPNNANVSKHIGKHFSAVGDRLANSIQIFADRKDNPHGYSEKLIDYSLLEIDKTVQGINFKDSVNISPIYKQLKLFGVTFIFYLIVLFSMQQNFYNAGYRLLHPFTKFTTPLEISISVYPGNTRVLKNEPVEITATVAGKQIKKLDLHLKEVTNEYHLTHSLLPKQENEFKFIIEHIQDTTEYYFSTEDYSTKKHLISVIELPLVRHLQIKITPPKYSNISAKLLDENVGDINCLKGSHVELNILSNKRLSKASLIFNNEKERALNISSDRANGGFRITEENNYHIKLIDEQEFKNKDPIEYRITIVEDIYPNVYISSPGQDVDLTEDLILPLTIEAEDDFGFSNLRLGYRIIKANDPFADSTLNFVPLTIDTNQKEKSLLDYNWHLTSLGLFAGDVIRYYAEVFDNDVVSGPKSSKSLIYSARFPTLEEIFTEVNTEQEETYESFQGLYEKSKHLKENIEKVAEEMKQNPELNWEEKKHVEDIIKNQQQLEKSLQEVQQQIDQMVERMEKNDLLSLETLQKYSELQKMMNDIMTEELKEAIEKLQQAVEKIDEEMLKQAIEQLNFTQEEFLKNIEKTLNILKRLQIEQKLDELVKRAEQLLSEQTDINEQMQKQLSKTQQNKQCQNQEATKNKTSDLLTETNQLKNKMDEFADMPAEKIDELLQEMSQQELLMNMDQVQSTMKSGKMQGAKKSGNKAQQSLSQMLDMLNQAKKDMIEKQKQEIMAELSRLSHNFLSLSKNQEQALNQSRKLNRNSPQLTALADDQQNLLTALSRSANRMAALSNKTFFVSSQLSRQVGQSLKSMGDALAQFEARNMSQTTRNQQRAMVSLNEAIKQIMAAMKELENASSASGFEEFMKKLSQMAGKQQGINQQTLQLGSGQQSLSLGQQAAMARLAAQQEALRKSMQQLQGEFGERSEILGRLDQVGKDMEDVVKDLQKRNVSQRTINRQQKILQRLLDAQKSARRQDYSRKRKAESGKYYPAMSPTQLSKNLGEKNIEIQRDLLKALKEGYSKDYKELIKKYFEALMKEAVENAEN